MQIVLPPEVEAFVHRQLISGKYNSAIEVIIAKEDLEEAKVYFTGRGIELL